MSRIVLQKGNLFDARNGILKPDYTVVISNGQIEWVGEYSSFDPEPSDTVLVMENKTILPGMVDCHVHIEYNFKAMEEINGFMFRNKEAYMSIFGLRNAQEYLKYGFTTIRDCASWTKRSTSSVRMAIENGLYPGPRLLIANRSIRQYGDQEKFGPDIWLEASKEYDPISGKEGIIHAVRDRRRDGSDFVKTQTTGGVLHGKESKLKRTLWTKEELETMVKEAERLDMYLAVHAHTEPGIEYAIKAGARTIEHGSLINEDSIRHMIKKGTYLVPTHSPHHMFSNPDERVGMYFHPEVVDKAKMIGAKTVEAHRIAFERGTKIALGTDAPVGGDHCHSPRELELMVTNLGMTPIQALQSATWNAAEALRLNNQIGSIEVGKKADVVVVSGDPSSDIGLFKNSHNIDYVFRNGNILAKQGKIVTA